MSLELASLRSDRERLLADKTSYMNDQELERLRLADENKRLATILQSGRKEPGSFAFPEHGYLSPLVNRNLMETDSRIANIKLNIDSTKNIHSETNKAPLTFSNR